MTLPDGSKAGFTFLPVPVDPPAGSGAGGVFASQLLNYYTGWSQPKFIPDPGVTASLTLDKPFVLVKDAEGNYQTGDGVPFNPASYLLDTDYVLTGQDGASFRYDGQTGDLLNLGDRAGNTIVTDDTGITSKAPDGSVLAGIAFTRDGQGRITRVTDPAGKSVAYAYNAQGDLVGVTDRVGSQTTLKYETPGRPHFLSELDNAEGTPVLRAHFGADGRLDGLTDAGGHTAPLSYSLTVGTNRFVEVVTDALGNPTEMIRDERGNLVRQVQRPEDNANTSLIKYVVTAYEYDAKDHLLRQSQPFEVIGSANKYTAAPGVWSNTNTYDARGNPLTSTDALGNTRRFAYDAKGNMTSVTDALGHIVSQSTYDAAGRVTTSTDASGVTTTFTYDAAGNQTGSSYTWVNPENTADTRLVTTSAQHDAAGRVTRSVAADGAVTLYTYDALGRVAGIPFARRRANSY